MWMVRSASGGRLADECISKGVVTIGWGDIGDLSRFEDKKSIIHAMEQQWPDWKPGRVMSSASQLIRFRDELSVGDRVLTYDASRRVYHIGRLSGDYQYQEGLVPPFENIRNVNWEGEIERDKLSVATRNILGSTLTLFLIPDGAAAEIESALKGEQAPSESDDDADSLSSNHRASVGVELVVRQCCHLRASWL